MPEEGRRLANARSGRFRKRYRMNLRRLIPDMIVVRKVRVHQEWSRRVGRHSRSKPLRIKLLGPRPLLV
jgi:hypothetical protein